MFFAPLIINRIGGKNALRWLALLCLYVLLAHRSPPQRGSGYSENAAYV